MFGRILVAMVLLGASTALVWQVFFNMEPDAGPKPIEVPSTAEGQPYAPRDWNTEHAGKLNISVYTFRDVNRNGIYDVGDLPMAGIVVDMTKPDGELHRAKSNVNGYANFKMSLSDDQQPVTQPRETYQFQVVAPPDWEVSSANAVQSVHFLPLAGSVAGLIAQEAPQWVGLMTNLSITGGLVTAKPQPFPPDLQVWLHDPQGESQELTVRDGQWETPAYPGNWRLLVSSQTLNWAVERTIVVAHSPVVSLPLVIGEEPREALRQAQVENFDWLLRSTIDKIPNGHGGLDWDYLLAVDNQQYGGPGYVNGLVSGHAVAYNSSGHPVTISAPAGSVFDFVGGYFSIAWPAAQGELLDVVAWRHGVEVARHAVELSYLGPVWIDAQLRGIEKLSLSTRHYWQFVADDLFYQLPAEDTAN
ncbi:MAG: hypothetical protein ACI9JM_000450 [Halioglobus sp.]|jgi:hypothetical protein